ncbi:MAG: branched-chain amino acid ABC transporter substrate-binding protein [Rhodobacteraceae bacterium]|nr:branched-chain amino acid ABC transporter substrate-binding protein [Paracoccaceae bacterium]MAY44595.1 branched-chain amino acid ABC transporter substrate-binding protein [Paracoccaceae bacterium]
MRNVLFCAIFAGLWGGAFAGPVRAEVDVTIAFVRVAEKEPLPLSRLEEPAEDDAVAGAELGLADNATTGRFMGQTYALETLTPAPGDAVAEVRAAHDGGLSLFVVQASEDTLKQIADAVPDALVFNVKATDDDLRLTGCKPNVFNVVPSRAMKADALAQYLVWKKWDRWMLIRGSHPEDIAMADAYRRAAGKFGIKIVEERVYEDTGGSRRSDSGHVLVQRQMPIVTQNAKRHDVVVVADENEVFAAYVPYRTWDATPVAGDAGLRVRDWHPANEAWGATQLQTRFEKQSNRYMSDRDYLAWLAVRIIGEAVTRTNSNNPGVLRTYLRSDAFEIPGFKGQALSFRPWNQQLRQGILLADGPMIVTVSPQEEFLHQRTRLDTLGYDEPETECSLDD